MFPFQNFEKLEIMKIKLIIIYLHKKILKLNHNQVNEKF